MERNTPKHYRDYSADEKAAALAFLDANGGNLLRTARQTGVPRKTLARWRAGGAGICAAVEQLANEKKEDLADLFERHAYHALARAEVLVEDPETEYFSALKGAATAVDKMRLLREQPTSITRDLPPTVEELDRVEVPRDRQAGRFKSLDGPLIMGQRSLRPDRCYPVLSCTWFLPEPKGGL